MVKVALSARLRIEDRINQIDVRTNLQRFSSLAAPSNRLKYLVVQPSHAIPFYNPKHYMPRFLPYSFPLRHASQTRSLAGHSHYQNTRHRKAAVDAARQSTFQRLARDVRIAVTLSAEHNDPKASARLARAIENARRAGMPKQRLDRLLESAARGAARSETALFEGVLRSGVGVLVWAGTERKNGVTSELRAVLARADGELAKAGWMFEERALVVVRELGVYSVEEVGCCGIEEGVEDVVEMEDGGVELVCEGRRQSERVRDGLTRRLPLLDGGGVYTVREFRPKRLVEVRGEGLQKVRGLLEALDRHPDVRDVVHNAEFVEVD